MTRKGPSTRRQVLAAACALAAARPAGGAAQEPRLFRIGTGGPTGTYFVIGGLMADVLSSPPGTRPCRDERAVCGVPGLIATAQSSAGSVANVGALVRGGVESALVQADIAFAAREADGPFTGEPPAAALRTLASLYPETLHVLARRGLEIAGPGDLRGRRVALDAPGSGTLVTALQVLDAFGLGPGDLEPAYLRGGTALARLREGTLDAVISVGGAPLLDVGEALAAGDAVLVPVAGAPVAGLIAAYPHLMPGSIPAGAYAGTGAAVDTVAVAAQWLTLASMDEALAFALVRALFRPGALERLRQGHPLGARIELAQATFGLAVPLHEGAARFYRARGVLDGD
jgi:hypothetical protein